MFQVLKFCLETGPNVLELYLNFNTLTFYLLRVSSWEESRCREVTGNISNLLHVEIVKVHSIHIS